MKKCKLLYFISEDEYFLTHNKDIDIQVMLIPEYSFLEKQLSS